MAGYLMAIVLREAGFATALHGPEAGSPAGQSMHRLLPLHSLHVVTC